MRILRLLFIYGVICALAPAVAAQSSVKNGTRGGGSSYWTPERLSEATPLPLPRSPAGGFLQPNVVEDRSRKGESGPAVPPAEDVGRELEIQLLPPRQRRGAAGDGGPSGALEPKAAPKARLVSGALFTQSRSGPASVLRRFPFRTVGKLFFADPATGDPFVCSGALVQRRIVLTAGHCVFNAERGPSPDNFNDEFLFVPAYNNGRGQFGEWTWDVVFTTDSWLTGGGVFPNAADFALLVIRDRRVRGRLRAIGDMVGWLGFETNAAASNHATILGYPVNLDDGERMQQSMAETFRLESPNAALYGSYMLGGSSGGPFVQNFGTPAAGQPEDPQNSIVGVVSYGPGDDPFLTGTSILNREFLRMLDDACADAVDNCER
jgi:V8-like Glu-specific endopeptidase